MTTTVLLALLKKLEGKVDSLEIITFEPVTELPETGESNVIYLVPKSDPETGNYSDEYIWDSNNQSFEKIGDTIIYPLPYVTAADNGKVLGVVDGEWAVYTIPKELPAVSSSDNGKILGVSSGVWTKINPTPNANTNIAPVYSSSSTYNKGDLVIYNNTLYECIVSIKTAENWTANHWEAKTVADEFAGIENEINGCDVYDNVPYNFRTSGGTLEIGDREYDTLVGGTVAFNQLVENGDFASAMGWTSTYGSISIANNVCTFTPQNNINSRISHSLVTSINHKYLLCAILKPSKATKVLWSADNSAIQGLTAMSMTANVWNSYCSIANANAVSANFSFFVNRDITLTSDDTVEIKSIQIIDLTRMFGSTIADYIYSLEQATAGSGVAYFRSLFPKDYYAYNAGQLMSVKALSHKMVGFNQWDEEWELGVYNTDGVKTSANNRICSKNKIKVLPNTVYYTTQRIQICEYDGNENFIVRNNFVNANATFTTGANTYYIAFHFETTYGTTYKNDTCINLHWDGERDGEYEAYSEHIYPLDSDLELRGIPKLDANNNLYYDGDTYESDGTVTRKYGLYTFTGSESWTWNSANEFWYTNLGLNPIAKTTTKSSGSEMNTKNLYMTFVNGTYVRIYSGSNTGIDSTTDMNTILVNGDKLLYEFDTPFTETADTFENPQLVDNWGTEEYTDSRDVQIPVGHITKYPRGIKSLMAIMEQEIEEAKELPSVTSTDEGKVLTVDSNGKWVAGNIPDGSNTSY